jgi:hypothetical protein
MQNRQLQVHTPKQQGMLLMELLLAVLLSAFLVLGLMQVVSAARSSFRLQESEAQAFTPDTQNHVSARSDRIALRFWSNLNCFENRNPILDEAGNPAFFIRESVFDMNSTRGLTHTCRYGPTEAEFITQIRRQGFIRNVDSFQVLFGEDRDGDSNIDSWVLGGEWSDEKQVLGVRFGLLLSSSEVVVEPAETDFSILDFQYTTRADGKLHRLFEFTSAIKGRNG